MPTQLGNSPRRVLFMQCDSTYFRSAITALRSFALYNEGWELVVADIGMTKNQVNYLSNIALVYKYEKDSVALKDNCYAARFPQAGVRLVVLYNLLVTYPSDTVFLQLDADTVCLGSIDPLVQEFTSCPVCMAAATEHVSIGSQVNDFHLAEQLYPGFMSWQHLPSRNWGMFLCRGPEAAKIMQYAYTNLINHQYLFSCREQTAGNCACVLFGDMVLIAPQQYNQTFQKGFKKLQVMSDFSVVNDKTPWTPIVILHYSDYKLQYQTSKEPGPFGLFAFWQRYEKHLQRLPDDYLHKTFIRAEA